MDATRHIQRMKGRHRFPYRGKRKHPDGRDRSRRARVAAQAARAVENAILETVWPTRCAVCDEPGELLCERCRGALAAIDRWRACPACGAPYGRDLCTECNPVVLDRLGIASLPFDACASAVVLDDAAHRIACLFKDAGERRLADVMADVMEGALDPSWVSDTDAITWVPATAAAFRRRGFDHTEELARALGARLRGGPRVQALLDRPDARDQRGLSRAERIGNTAGRFRALDGVRMPRRVIVVDDVMTTGATLMAASAALRAAGARSVRCLTFARAV